jgi:hypothetical protein
MCSENRQTIKLSGIHLEEGLPMLVCEGSGKWKFIVVELKQLSAIHDCRNKVSVSYFCFQWLPKKKNSEAKLLSSIVYNTVTTQSSDIQASGISIQPADISKKIDHVS